MDEKKIDNKSIDEKPKREKKEQYVILENKNSYPYEIKINRVHYRFEPRLKQGCQIRFLKSEIDNDKNFKFQSKHFIITEVK